MQMTKSTAGVAITTLKTLFDIQLRHKTLQLFAIELGLNARP